jgi:uncharacterized protein YndB with AHSA1/START domain
MSRDIVHAIGIDAGREAVFSTIGTRSGLAAFWTPDVQGSDAEGEELTFGFSGAPVRLPMRVANLDPPSSITWECPGGFPDWRGTRITWSIEPSDHGTRLIFVHSGFGDDQPDYDFGSISLTWAQVVARLKEVVESGGDPDPALS